LKNERVNPGAAVAAVFYVDTQPYYAYCRVVSTHPFKIECAEEQAALLSPATRLMLVFEGAKGFSRAVSTVRDIRQIEGGCVIDAEEPTWELLEKRCYPRHEVRVPVSVRTAIETNGQAEFAVVDGHTENVGLGGAWINIGRPLSNGNLVEVLMRIQPTIEVRILGIIVRSESEQGFAVQFLDYIGSARYHLHNFLNQAA
jgi:hypothetical protein